MDMGDLFISDAHQKPARARDHAPQEVLSGAHEKVSRPGEVHALAAGPISVRLQKTRLKPVG